MDPRNTYIGGSDVAPGIYPGVPYEVYASWPGVRSSHLKELDRSPLHYRHALKNPRTSKALSLGTAAHCAVLEPERFGRDFAVWDRRTDGGALAPRRGKAWDEFQAEHDGRTIITADESDDARAISRAVRSHATAAPYLISGAAEVSMLWQAGGHTLQIRADWLTSRDGADVVVGLKTARDCRLFQFGSQAAKLRYHIQWAMYYDGFTAITGRAPYMVEIVVESAAPHDVAVYHIPEDIIMQGREEYTRLLTLLGDCQASDYWPGAVDGEQELTLPSWVYGHTDDDISDLGLTE